MRTSIRLRFNDRACGYRVTPRMREIWTLLAEGLPPKVVASNLGISQKTVEFHKAHIAQLFNVRRNDAMFYRLAVAFGLVDKQKPIQ